MKNLKIPKGLPKSENLRTENTMTRRQRTKGKQWSRTHFAESTLLSYMSPTKTN